MIWLLALAGAMFAAGWIAARLLVKPEVQKVAVTSDAGPPVEASVLDRHPTGVVICTAVGAVQYRNAAATGLAGTHAGVLVDAAIDKHVARALRGEASSEVLEFFGPPKRVMAVSSEPLQDGRVAVFIDDITERRRVDQMRTDFVANVSHELRTPIGALMVLAETVADTDDPEVIARIASRMQAEADRASHTIDDLLELSELEAGRQRSDEPVRLADVVADATARVGALAEQHDISISALDPVGREGPQAAGLVVRGDRRQLASAVGNVVENAVKHGHSGGHIQIRVRQADGWGEIVVADDGPGIPRRDLDRIFERFYRVDRGRSRASGGTGLGLSIVRHVMQNHDGEVAVESTEGEGTTFVFRLPLIAGGSAGADQSQEGVA